MNDEFLIAIGEPPFEHLKETTLECYRLSVEESQAGRRVVRLQRSKSGSHLVALFLIRPWADEAASIVTYDITLEDVHWIGMNALLEVAKFWELSEDDRSGLDGAIYVLEAWDGDRSHTVTRWSPNPIIPGGELFCLVTDYLERLAELAMIECDSELQQRFAAGYAPKRMSNPRGGFA